MLQIGSLLDGKYRILSEIGHGGMSIVYMAMNEKANKTWAVKEVRKDGVKDFEIVRQGLVAETDILKKLNHPNLPSIIDVIDNEDTFLIVMDYIEGNDLQAALDEYGAQPQDVVVNWGKQLCDVLGYLHTRKPPIIYRDMKPKNVMLRPDGRLALIDFGTAREFKEKNLQDTTCLGTAGYAAPEQYGNMGQTDPRTDIYCLGATLYHLITGCNPCETPFNLRPITEVNPTLSKGLEKIIIKCTEHDRENRYQSCAELMYDLEHYLDIDDQSRKNKKNKIVAFAVTCTLAVLFGVSGIITGQAATNMATDQYRALIEEADKETNAEQKEKLYKRAIEVPNKSGDTEAYLELISLYKEDGCSLEEYRSINALIENNKTALQVNKAEYAELCYEVGKLIWYYYTDGQVVDGIVDASLDNFVTRASTSRIWFENALSSGGSDFKYQNACMVYSAIGAFYRDIDTNVTEANDGGTYRTLWDSINQLLDIVNAASDESEIVKTELYTFSISSFNKYATGLKRDGIQKQDMVEFCRKIEQDINAVDIETASSLEERVGNARTALDNLYRRINDVYGEEGDRT